MHRPLCDFERGQASSLSTITRFVWWRTRFLESCLYRVQEGEDTSFPWKWFIIAGNYRGSAARLRFHAIRWLKKQDEDGESGWMGCFAICYGLWFWTLSFCDISIVFGVIKPLLFCSLSVYIVSKKENLKNDCRKWMEYKSCESKIFVEAYFSSYKQLISY